MKKSSELQKYRHDRTIEWTLKADEPMYYCLFDWGSITIEQELNYFERPRWVCRLKNRDGETLRESEHIKNEFDAQTIGSMFYHHYIRKNGLHKKPEQKQTQNRKKMVLRTISGTI